MPKGFDYCIKQGGRVITKPLNGGRYIHICYLGDKSYAGEVHTKKKETKKK